MKASNPPMTAASDLELCGRPSGDYAASGSVPVVDAASPVRYFHGGPPGLSEILPSTETGAASSASFGAIGVCRRDRIYVTTSLHAAIGFASLCPPDGRGAVYEVAPFGLRPDPDCDMPGLSFEAESATVVRRVPVPGKVLKKARRAMTTPNPDTRGPEQP